MFVDCGNDQIYQRHICRTHMGPWCLQQLEREVNICTSSFKTVYAQWRLISSKYEWQCSEFKQVLHHGCMFTSWNQFHIDFLSSLSELCVTCSNAGAHRLYCCGCLFSWVFLQLLSINIYVSMASNLTADLGLGGNSHTAVGLARKKQQLQFICPPCFGSPLFPGTCCVQSFQLYSEIMTDSWTPFGEAIMEKKNLKNYKSANAGSPLSQQTTWE